MKKSRLERVRRVEGRRQPTRTPAASVEPAAASKPISLAPRPSADVARRLELAHQLGLSVAEDASAGEVDRLLRQFERVSVYVAEIARQLTGGPESGDGMSIPNEHPSADRRWNHFVASLFDDGRLVLQVLEAAEAGETNPRSRGGRIIANHLRRAFPEHLPRRGLLDRLLNRP